MRIQITSGNLDFLGFSHIPGGFSIEPDNPEPGFATHRLGGRVKTVHFIAHIVIQHQNVFGILQWLKLYRHGSPVRVRLRGVEVVEETGIEIVVSFFVRTGIGSGHEGLHH